MNSLSSNNKISKTKKYTLLLKKRISEKLLDIWTLLQDINLALHNENKEKIKDIKKKGSIYESINDLIYLNSRQKAVLRMSLAWRSACKNLKDLDINEEQLDSLKKEIHKYLIDFYTNVNTNVQDFHENNGESLDKITNQIVNIVENILWNFNEEIWPIIIFFIIQEIVNHLSIESRNKKTRKEKKKEKEMKESITIISFFKIVRKYLNDIIDNKEENEKSDNYHIKINDWIKNIIQAIATILIPKNIILKSHKADKDIIDTLNIFINDILKNKNIRNNLINSKKQDFTLLWEAFKFIKIIIKKRFLGEKFMSDKDIKIFSLSLDDFSVEDPIFSRELTCASAIWIDSIQNLTMVFEPIKNRNYIWAIRIILNEDLDTENKIEKYTPRRLMQKTPLCFYITKERELVSYGNSQDLVEFELWGKKQYKDFKKIVFYNLKKLLEANYRYLDAPIKEATEKVDTILDNNKDTDILNPDRELGKESISNADINTIERKLTWSLWVLLPIWHKPSPITYENYKKHWKGKVDLCAYIFNWTEKYAEFVKVIKLEIPENYQDFLNQLEKIKEENTIGNKFVRFQTYRSYDNPVFRKKTKSKNNK